MTHYPNTPNIIDLARVFLEGVFEVLAYQFDDAPKEQRNVCFALLFRLIQIDENVKLLDLSQSQLNNSQKVKIKQIFKNYAYVLSSKPEQLGCLKGYKYDIELPDDCPKFRAAPYRPDLSGREAMKKELDKLLTAGIILDR